MLNHRTATSSWCTPPAHRPRQAPSDSSSNDDDKTPPFSTFTCFPHLHFDLRVMIWKIVCFEPRNVDIGLRYRGIIISDWPPEKNPKGHPGTEPYHLLYAYSSLCRLPPALHVNEELRTKALRWYKLEFGREVTGDGYSTSFPPKTYAKFEIDRLCWLTWGEDHFFEETEKMSNFPNVEFYQLLCKEKNVRRMALNPRCKCNNRQLLRGLTSLVSQIASSMRLSSFLSQTMWDLHGRVM